MQFLNHSSKHNRNYFRNQQETIPFLRNWFLVVCSFRPVKIVQLEQPYIEKRSSTSGFSEARELLTKIKNQMETVIIGKTDAVELVLAAFLARGHILLEDLREQEKPPCPKPWLVPWAVTSNGFSLLPI